MIIHPLPNTLRRSVSPTLGLLITVLLFTGSTGAVAEETIDFPGLQALMTEEEFATTGLKKLSPAERAALNRWLAARGRFKLEIAQPNAQTEPPPKPKDAAQADSDSKRTAAKSAQAPKRIVAKRLKRSERTAVKPIRTRIVGKFKGWSGSTLFALENGQYWKQRQPGRYYYKAESPEVELFKNRLGFWEIKILATGKTVKVSRFEP